MTDFLIKSTIAMAALLAIYHLLFEREKMHRFNRFYLISALVFSLALPFITIPVYVQGETDSHPMVMEQQLEFREQEMPQTQVKPVIAIKDKVVNKTKESQINYLPYISWRLYLLITLILSIRFAKNIIHFYRLKRNNLSIRYKGTSLVVLVDDVLPHTFLSTIYISKKDYDNKEIVPELFTHELAHANQLHTLDILFIETLKTIFWFNPLLYFYKKAIQLNHEFLADEKVINTTANTVYYQQLLLEKATVGKTFSIASNLNFSLTKKRFIMMTKTTNQTKGILLKFAVLPASVGLLYFLSTETVVLAKTNLVLPAKIIEPEITTSTFEINALAPQDSILQQTQFTVASKKAVTDPEARKNEYFKGVRVIIEDAQKGKYVDLPYENLTAEDRKYYLPEAPDKKKGGGISNADYDYSLSEKNNENGCNYYLDDHKVTREEILKYKKEDFATYAAKSTGMQLVDGKLKGNNFSFFYTYDYFNKYLKHSNDHYPDKSLKITITEKPLDVWLGHDFNSKEKDGLKNDLERLEAKEKKEKELMIYPTVEEIKKRQRSFYPRFPEGNEKFDEYLANNIKLNDKLKDKQISISFTVNTNGSLSNTMILGENDEEINSEIAKVIEKSSVWIPAQDNGKPYKVGISVNYPPNPKK